MTHDCKALMAFIACLALLTLPAAATAQSTDGAPLTRDRVAIALYSDFQCPYCARFATPFRELQAKGVDGLALDIEFRNFPLSIHANAQLAHQAAMAAKAQGKFWEMHDLLFANLARVQRSDLVGYAGQLGLDIPRFERDIDSEAVKQAIAADVAEGNKAGVSGTPTYSINGKMYSGTRTLEQLRGLIAGDRRRARALAEIGDPLLAEGPATAPVTIELFADLVSPVSRPALVVVRQAMARHPASVRLQFRNFPLAFHPQAALAHEAAMTAARDGRFWPFADFVLAHQDTVREPDLVALAARLGHDASAFAQTLQDRRYAPRVDADVEVGRAKGLRGSPVVLVNGQRIDGVPDLDQLTRAIEAALEGRPVATAGKP